MNSGSQGVKTNLLFFTKGRKTERIWYYDLSHRKVGKKSPLTLAHFGFSKTGQVLDNDQLPLSLTADWFADEGNQGKPFPSYARYLNARGTPKGASRYSWTVDFAARRAKARADMQPFLDEAARLKAIVVGLKERLKLLKKEKAKEKQVDALETNIRIQEKAIRDAEAKAAGIDATAFDLKAVNPNATTKVDTRTPEEVIQNIEAQGQIVSASLTRLKALLKVVS